jgi:carboxypeptidase Q
MDSVDSRPDYRDVIYSPLHGPEDFAKYKGKLQGKIVLMADMRVLEMHTEPEAHRLTAEEIQARTLTPDPSRAGGFGGARRPAGPTPVPTTAPSAVELRNQINNFLSDEDAALTPGVNGDGGTVCDLGRLARSLCSRTANDGSHYP